MQADPSTIASKFARVQGRLVVADFTGGSLTSDAGGLLLGAADPNRRSGPAALRTAQCEIALFFACKR
jgi:hypothetical protein